MGKHHDSGGGSARPAGRRPLPYPTAEPGPRPRGRLPLALAVLAIALVAAAGITFVVSPQWGGGSEAATRNVGRVPSSGGKLVDFVSPRSIEIPRLHARAPIVKVGTQNRELDIPLNPKVVGWWAGGARPGDRRGTAILAGHINYAGVTGVLADIGRLDPGDTVYVTGMRAGKQHRLRFTITGVRTYRKTALPYRRIFDQHSVGRIAIVTCGGPFDASTGNYQDNVVAFAVPS
jgi:hypothetical protein